MTTRILNARDGVISDEVIQLAKTEGITPKSLSDLIACGQVVVIGNKNRNIIPVVVGNNLKTKICVSLLVDDKDGSLACEADKLRVAQVAGANCIFDVSCGVNIADVRKMLLSNSNIPVGLNPFNQIVSNITLGNFDTVDISEEEFLHSVEQSCTEGFDFISLNCSLTKEMINQSNKQQRLHGVVGASAKMMYEWVEKTGMENPFYKYYDEVLTILKKHDVVLHLACAFKSSNLSDAFDSLQIAEYTIIADLVRRANDAGVQVMTDGIGHVPINKISSLVSLIKEITLKVPLFVTSSFACDCAIGNDSIVQSISNSIAVEHGANMLNIHSGADYINLSSPSFIKEGIIAAKIAAHCGEVANGSSDAIKQNYKISFARKNSDKKNIIKNNIDKTVFEGLNFERY